MSPGPDYNREKGTVFIELFKGKDFAYHKSLTPKQGKYLHDSLGLGQEKYQILRKFLDPILGLPSPENLRLIQNEIVPEFETFLDGLWLPLPTLAGVDPRCRFEAEAEA